MTRDELIAYVREQYGDEPDYPWKRFPDYAVLRHPGTRKWYALVMDVERKKLGLDAEGRVDIVNVRCDEETHALFRRADGFFPAYHMNKEKWLSIVIDEVPDELITDFVAGSHQITGPKAKR